MCGICGFVTKRNIKENELQAMNDSSYRRGPDDKGTLVFETANGYTVGLGHRRLSIQDLSENGHQPMSTSDSRISLVFNGEIYNCTELKEELSFYDYKGTSDTEVILAAYLKWGRDLTSHLDGMFAFALFDRSKDLLILARDRVGKKPLYFYKENDGIVFASELKPIMLYPGFRKEINRKVLSRYLLQGYINAPESVFENVFKLEPGSVLFFENGKTDIKKYWDIYKTYHRKSAEKCDSYDEAKDRLKDLLFEAVKKRLVSDVPVGTFLSGGYDSSLVSAIACKVSDERVKTFCIGFEDEKYNEAPYARDVASFLGTDHTEKIITMDEMLEAVNSIPQAFDEPFADSSQIPTMLVSKTAREKVTVILTGDGGDEFFCGYGDYEKVRLAQLLDIPGAAAHAIGSVKIKGSRLEKRYPDKLRVISKNRDPETKTQLQADICRYYAREFVLRTEGELPMDYRMESVINESNWVKRRMLLDMAAYLPGDILCKVDRAGMYHSLEARCPILDTSVMEYSFSLPLEYKYKGNIRKRILKDIAYDLIPEKLLNRPKKGFAVPMDTWLRGPLKEELLTFSDTSLLKEQGLFNAEKLNSTVNRYLSGNGSKKAGYNSFVRMLWSFLVFERWYDTWIKKYSL